MIQRIQSVYLTLVLIFALLFLFLPIAVFQTDPPTILRIYNIPFQEFEIMNIALLAFLSLALCLFIMLLTLITIFRFKNRKNQIKLGKMNILLHVGLIVIVFFMIDELKTSMEGAFSYGYGVVFPLIAMILILLANRAIKKDEDLVRSSERLRP